MILPFWNVDIHRNAHKMEVCVPFSSTHFRPRWTNTKGKVFQCSRSALSDSSQQSVWSASAAQPPIRQTQIDLILASLFLFHCLLFPLGRDVKFSPCTSLSCLKPTGGLVSFSPSPIPVLKADISSSVPSLSAALLAFTVNWERERRRRRIDKLLFLLLLQFLPVPSCSPPSFLHLPSEIFSLNEDFLQVFQAGSGVAQW